LNARGCWSRDALVPTPITTGTRARRLHELAFGPAGSRFG